MLHYFLQKASYSYGVHYDWILYQSKGLASNHPEPRENSSLIQPSVASHIQVPTSKALAVVLGGKVRHPHYLPSVDLNISEQIPLIVNHDQRLVAVHYVLRFP